MMMMVIDSDDDGDEYDYDVIFALIVWYDILILLLCYDNSGMGGGAASSRVQGTADENLDFNAVQRGIFVGFSNFFLHENCLFDFSRLNCLWTSFLYDIVVFF